MLNFLRRVIRNPYRVVKRHKGISIRPSSILLDSCRFLIRSDSNKVSIGENTTVGCVFVFESNTGNIVIGDNTYIGGSTLISKSSIIIGSNVTIAWGTTIYDHSSHSLDYRERRNDIRRQVESYRQGNDIIENKDWSTVKTAPIVIEDDVWIGFDCIILKGVTIGEGAIIGAGSVVRDNVAPWTVVAGNPAVFVKSLKREK
ncbi:acyltransferase [Rheinheimera tangshanensis]|uniref:acyltransferase n=1 Tax=Rheinheimera tangshanensis TaxID=400153 RepID=UPI0019AE9722|nr:acyltransferase [Rheinheimera tangshanensis]GGM60862.1 maltose O-acetyltransferase [Rheinheimera tangshanensis]